MTKREWVIIQCAMAAYENSARYAPELVEDGWDSAADGPLPTGGEVGRAMQSLEELVGHIK